MAIVKNTREHNTNAIFETQLFVGRVLRVEKTVETRNWSDTMDYSDYRSTNCTYALVWLGTHGLPPGKGTRPMAHYASVSASAEEVPHYVAKDARDLEYWEQFAWVDCTNLFADRNGYSLEARTDAAPFISGDPLMWANFIAWESYMDSARTAKAAAAAKKAEAIRLAEEEKAAKAAARAAKAEAKLAATRAVADAEYAAALPFKGKTVSVDGFTGTVFWMGVKAYRGTFNANAGIKNSKGEVQWIRCNQLY